MARFGKGKQDQGVNKDSANLDEDIEMVNDAEGAEATEETVLDDEQAKLFGIPDYRTSSREERKAMDAYIASIDPYDLQSIMALGREEMQRLADVANEVTEKYASEDIPVLSSLSAAQESLGALDLSGMVNKVANTGKKGVGWAFRNPLTAAATGVGLVLAGPAALAIPGAKAAYDAVQHKAKGPDLSDALRESVQKTDETIVDIMKALDQIPEALEDIKALGRSRMESYKEVSIIIGAGRELIRRIDEKMIPELEKKYAQAPGNFELQERLEMLNMGRDALAQHIVSMMGSRAVSQSTAMSLMQLTRVFYTASSKLGNHLNHSIPQWQAQRAEAGIALLADKIAKTSDEADKRGTEMLVLGQKLNQNTAKLMQKSMTKGSYDTQKVIAVLQQQTSDLQTNLKALGNQRAEMDKAMLQLSDASKKFNDNISRFQETAGGRMQLPNMAPKDDAPAVAIEDQRTEKEETATPRRGGRKTSGPKL